MNTVIIIFYQGLASSKVTRRKNQFAKKMSLSDLERFRQLVSEDPALQETLLSVSDNEAFIALVIELGQQRGCMVSANDVQTALDAGRRSWLERYI